jgi:hypothetical protein
VATVTARKDREDWRKRRVILPPLCVTTGAHAPLSGRLILQRRHADIPRTRERKFNDMTPIGRLLVTPLFMPPIEITRRVRFRRDV